MDILSNIQLIKTTLENKLQPFVNDSTQIQMIHRNPSDLDFIIHIKKKNTEDRTIKFRCSLQTSRSGGVMCDYYSSDSIWTEPQTFNIKDNKKWKSILEDLFPESKTTKKKQQTTGTRSTQGGGGGNTMQQQKQQTQQTKK